MSIWKAESVEDTPRGLYRYGEVVTGPKGFSAITDGHIQGFHEQGYLVVHEAFRPAEVQMALAGLLHLIGGANPGYKGLQFEAKASNQIEHLTLEQKQDAVRKVWKFVNFEPRLKALSEHPALLAVVTRLIGETPVMFQDMALLKPPQIGREKPWHQDSAYFDLPLTCQVVGCWIALDKATPENGCMHIIPGSHRAGPVVHFRRRDWQICDTQVQTHRDVMVPLEPGGCLLFHGLLQHGTPPNSSPSRRRALQFHYRGASVKPIPTAERLAVFGSEGKNVQC